MTNPNDPVFSDRFVGVALTKREYFAAMALQGLLSNSIVGANIDGKELSQQEYAVTIADTLIQELNK